MGGGRLPQNGSCAHVTTSTPESHVTHMRELAAGARQEKAGVWAALLEQRNSFVAFGPDLLDVGYVEK